MGLSVVISIFALTKESSPDGSQANWEVVLAVAVGIGVPIAIAALFLLLKLQIFNIH